MRWDLSSERHTHSVAKLIEDNILTIGDGYRAKNVELASTGIPFARVANIDGGFNFAEADLFPLDDLYKVGEKISRPGDVVLTSKGTVGRFAFVREGTRQFVYSPQLSYWRSLDFNTIDPRFLFYWIQGEEFQEQADGVKSQTDMADYVSLTDQRRMKITLPPFPEQRAIARILGALDDKIELNRRMNHTLEEMARALFKSWFVDFDPVTAKAEGRVPFGMNAETASLFPAEFEETEEGSIPKGWKYVKIGEVMTNFDSRRVPLSGAQRLLRQGIYPYYGAASVMDYIDDYIFDGIYLLVGEDGSVEDSDGMAVTQYVWGKFWVNNHAHVLQGINGISTEHLYLHYQFEPISPYVTGAVQPKVNQGNLNSMPFLLPSKSVAEAFTKTVNPWFAKIRANQEEIKNLASIRDALLPKLLSGELRVKQADKVIENM